MTKSVQLTHTHRSLKLHLKRKSGCIQECPASRAGHLLPISLLQKDLLVPSLRHILLWQNCLQIIVIRSYDFLFKRNFNRKFLLFQQLNGSLPLTSHWEDLSRMLAPSDMGSLDM